MHVPSFWDFPPPKPPPPPPPQHGNRMGVFFLLVSPFGIGFSSIYVLVRILPKLVLPGRSPVRNWYVRLIREAESICAHYFLEVSPLVLALLMNYPVLLE